MKILARRAGRAIFGLCMIAAVGAEAQTYPARPITLIVPFAAGGTTDILGRLVAEQLGKVIGQPVVVENRGGAGGNLGAAAVATANPDGYTLLMGYNGTNAINPSLYKKLSWDPLSSFEPLSMIARVNNVVVVNPSLPIKTLPELVAYAKNNPGKLNYGSAGAGSIFHLAGVMLEQQAGVKMVHVAYRGAAPALADLAGGHVQVMFTTIPTALPLIQSGNLRAIAVTGPERSPLFPDLPNAVEAGYKQMVVDSWFAMFAPKGIPETAKQKLSTALRQVLSDPVLIKKLKEQGAEPLSSSSEEVTKLLVADIATWKAILTDAKLDLQ